MTIQQDLTTAPGTLHPFSEGQWQQLHQLLETFNEQQAFWLSGYLAAGKLPAKNTVTSNAAARTLIAYGTETGNSKTLAEQLAQRLGEQQVSARTVSLAELKPRALPKTDYLLLICSTHGDGDPPEPAVPFFDALQSDHAPRLEQVKFAVLALGDSSYEYFCTAGMVLDERLAQLGAQRILPRRDCDVDFQQPAEEWLQQVVELLPRSQAGAANGNLAQYSFAIAAPKVAARGENTKSYSKQHPLRAEVLDNICLSHKHRELPIHHLELLLDAQDFALEPGDAVGIMPHNPPALVAAVLDACGLSGDQAILFNGSAMPLVQALREQLDLTIPSQNFLEYWATASAGDTLQLEVQADAKQRRAFLKQQQLLDLLLQHRGTADAQALVNSLRPLQPRLYDVANAIEADTDEIHLVIKAYEYPINNKNVRGVASEFLLQLQPGETALIYPHHNKRFRLPEQPDTPLILIGWGTGVAPFRAFAQRIAQGKRTHPCWLVFGEQSFEDDFLYQLDWQLASAKGILQRLDAVFVDDQPDAQLSTPLVAQLSELADWIARGAHIYLCGDKELLTRCEAALQPLYDQLMASPAWQQLDRDKRIHRNLY